MRILVAILALFVVTEGVAAQNQHQIGIPAFSRTFSASTTRGFQFQTPIDMTIVALQVPDETNHGTQHAALYKFAAQLPAFPGSTALTPLEYLTAPAGSPMTLTSPQSFTAGDWVGVAGAAGDTTRMHNSYGPNGPQTINLQCNTTMGYRFLTQTNIASNKGVASFSSENAGAFGRVDVWYTSPVAIVGSGTGVGTTRNMKFTSPNQGGKTYQVASSLGTGPIPIDTRNVCLTADAVLFLSVSGLAPTVFSSYAGTLSATGTGGASLNIPKVAALVGIDISTAFVTIDGTAPSGIGSISDTDTFKITV